MIDEREFARFNDKLIENRYNFIKLLYLIFPYGDPSHPEMCQMTPRDWELQVLDEISKHFSDKLTRYTIYRKAISSGNGCWKTSFIAKVNLILMITTKGFRGRVTANTQPQMTTNVWPEYRLWFGRARFMSELFEISETRIRNKHTDAWHLDTFNWSPDNPAAISGLHTHNACTSYTFEEAPGIPAVIWDYARGAFTDPQTMKVFFALGNSDDPESKFEQCMQDPKWNPLRIDTRTVENPPLSDIQDILDDCAGDEDHDDFRVRVRGLPRKSSEDAVIPYEIIKGAVDRGKSFDPKTTESHPCIIGCDPAWTGGDKTSIWVRRGTWSMLLAWFSLDKLQDHNYTYKLLCHYETKYKADAVTIDKGEGTGLWSMARRDGRENWYIVDFGSIPLDAPKKAESQYENMRAYMYYNAKEWLEAGCVQVADTPEAKVKQWLENTQRQFCWSKKKYEKVSGRKMVEAKDDIRDRVGSSPDIVDGFVVTFGIPMPEKRSAINQIGSSPLIMPQTGYDPYKGVGDKYPFEPDRDDNATRLMDRENKMFEAMGIRPLREDY